jgi:hypothetical protein
MKERDVDDILKRAADGAPDVDPALLERIANSLGSGLRPVAVLPSSWILTSGLMLICAIVAIAGASILGFSGVRKMTSAEIAIIFSALGVLAWAAASLSVAEMVPGSRKRLSAGLLGGIACIDLAVVFALLFDDYGTEQFVVQGMKCLIAGLAIALPASGGAWMLLRRGFAVNSACAAFAMGTLAGLAGVTMLELHCPNFEVLHLLVWHIAVLPVSGGIAVLVNRYYRTGLRSA